MTVAICLIMVGTSMSASTSLGARKDPNGVTWGELQLLPEYCRDANGIVWGDASFNPSPNAGRWVAMMGEDFWHIHHYCYALANLRRAELETNPTKKRFVLGRVLGDYVYMIKNASPSLIVMPEILVRTGDVHRQLGNTGDALMAYQSAMDIKRDYWPAYSRAATIFAEAKSKARVLEILERGLIQVPGSKELQQQYVAAGGDLKKFALNSAPVRNAMMSSVDAAASSASASNQQSTVPSNKRDLGGIASSAASAASAP